MGKAQMDDGVGRWIFLMPTTVEAKKKQKSEKRKWRETRDNIFPRFALVRAIFFSEKRKWREARDNFLL